MDRLILTIIHKKYTTINTALSKTRGKTLHSSSRYIPVALCPVWRKFCCVFVPPCAQSCAPCGHLCSCPQWASVLIHVCLSRQSCRCLKGKSLSLPLFLSIWLNVDAFGICRVCVCVCKNLKLRQFRYVDSSVLGKVEFRREGSLRYLLSPPSWPAWVFKKANVS